MNISKRQTQGKTLTLYTGIFFVLFFVLLVGCVQVSVGCDVSNIDIKDRQAALEKCKENPNVTVKGEF
jgi:hypothetical protein